MTIKHFIHDAQTGETVEVELTAEEISEREAAEAEFMTKKANEEQAKIAAREALLARLGMTEEEAKLLFA